MRPSPLGTKHEHRRGYVWIRTEYGWELEHRAVMRSKLRRWLRTDEHVHHKDGNKKNNDAANLEVIEAGPHKSMHMAKERKAKESLCCLGCGAPRSLIPHAGYGLCKRCDGQRRIAEATGRVVVPRKDWKRGDKFGMQFGNGSKGLRKYNSKCVVCGRKRDSLTRGMCDACYCRWLRRLRNPTIVQRRRRI